MSDIPISIEDLRLLALCSAGAICAGGSAAIFGGLIASFLARRRKESRATDTESASTLVNRRSAGQFSTNTREDKMFRQCTKQDPVVLGKIFVSCVELRLTIDRTINKMVHSSTKHALRRSVDRDTCLLHICRIDIGSLTYTFAFPFRSIREQRGSRRFPAFFAFDPALLFPTYRYTRPPQLRCVHTSI